MIAGKRARKKGPSWERKVADDLRLIYDPVDLLKALAAARKLKDQKEVRKLLKASCVRRSEQAKGAKEPDVVVEAGKCPVWIECEDAKVTQPEAKFTQAQKDIAETRSALWPAAICHQFASPHAKVYMALHHLVRLSRIAEVDLAAYALDRLNLHSKAFDMKHPVCIDYRDFLVLLSADHEWRRSQKDE